MNLCVEASWLPTAHRSRLSAKAVVENSDFQVWRWVEVASFACSCSLGTSGQHDFPGAEGLLKLRGHSFLMVELEGQRVKTAAKQAELGFPGLVEQICDCA